jgi:hypothetical protein
MSKVLSFYSITFFSLILSSCNSSPKTESVNEGFLSQKYANSNFNEDVYSFLRDNLVDQIGSEYIALFFFSKQGCSGCVKEQFDEIYYELAESKANSVLILNDSTIMERLVPTNHIHIIIAEEEEIKKYNLGFQTLGVYKVIDGRIEFFNKELPK